MRGTKSAALALVAAVSLSGPAAALAGTKTINGLGINLVLDNAQRGVQYSYTIAVTGGSGPYTFQLIGGSALPTDYTMSSGGVITGISCANPNGNYSFDIRITDSSATPTVADFTGSSSPSIQMNAAPNGKCDVQIGLGSLPGTGTVGTAYSGTLTASGGTAPYTFTIVTGSLPNGLTLSGSSVSGTPSATGTFTFQIKGQDAVGNTGYSTYSIVVGAAGAISIGPATLPDGNVGVAYSQTISASGCGGSGCTFSLSSGTLPSGLTLSAAGLLSGTPATGTQGSYSIEVSAADGTSTAKKTYTLVIGGALAISPSTLPNATILSSYSQALSCTVAAVSSSCSYSLDSGSLPPGMSVDAAGAVSGTPTAAGTYTFTVAASNGVLSAKRSYSLVVGGGLAIGPSSLPGGTPGAPYAQALTCGVSATSGGGVTVLGVSKSMSAVCTLSLSSGALPPGLSLDAAGKITGTPSAAGTYTFTVAGTMGSLTASRTYTIVIGRLVLDPPELPSGARLTPYSQTLVASGGTAPYAYSIVGGALPPGLDLDGVTGVVSGSPQLVGRFAFRAKAVDRNGAEATNDLVITITGAETLTVGPAALPSVAARRPYSQQLSANGGIGPYKFVIVSGSLPPGLTLDPDTGVVSGTPTQPGEYTFTVQASDSKGDYGRRTYTIKVESRPDPSQDAEVQSMVDNQMETGLRFAQGQIDNVMQHLQSARSGLSCGLSNNVTVRVDPKQSGQIEETSQAQAQTQGQPAPAAAAREQDCAQPKISTWTGGSLDYGTAARDEFTTSGLTVGFDLLHSRSFLLGAAFGAGWDKGTLGGNGSKASASSVDFMAYASYRLARTLTVEAMTGYGTLGVDNTRFVTGDRGRLTSNRPGHMTYAALSVGGDLRAGLLVVTPYLRNDLVSVHLDAYREDGASLYALGFASTSQTVDVLVAGSRVSYRLGLPWGHIGPMARVELRHRFSSSYTQALFYADLPDVTYDMIRGGDRRDYVTASVGVEAAAGRWTFGLEYGSSASTFESLSGGTLRGSARLGF